MLWDTIVLVLRTCEDVIKKNLSLQRTNVILYATDKFTLNIIYIVQDQYNVFELLYLILIFMNTLFKNKITERHTRNRFQLKYFNKIHVVVSSIFLSIKSLL